MYSLIVKSMVRDSYRLFNHRKIEALLDRYSLPMPNGHIFSGRHALAGTRHTRDAILTWASRVFALFPDLYVHPRRVWVSGWPWRTFIAVEWADYAMLKNGDRFRNEGVQVAEIRWGKVVGTKWYVDTQHAAETMEQLSAEGVPDATAAPIVD